MGLICIIKDFALVSLEMRMKDDCVLKMKHGFEQIMCIQYNRWIAPGPLWYALAAVASNLLHPCGNSFCHLPLFIQMFSWPVSNQYETYNQVLNLINYLKACKMCVEVYFPGPVVSRVCVFCIAVTPEKLWQFVVVVTACTNCPLTHVQTEENRVCVFWKLYLGFFFFFKSLQ